VRGDVVGVLADPGEERRLAHVQSVHADEAERSNRYGVRMCRNIHTLHNFDPPATEEEISAAALQYVRKVSGFAIPSRANEEAFARAVDEVAVATKRLLDELVTSAPARDREREAARARARAAQRFGSPAGGEVTRVRPRRSRA
jgi:hypothetical protein